MILRAALGAMFWLAASLGMLSGVVILASRTAPQTNGSIMAQNSCPLPCVFGITPGQTRRDEVEAKIENIVLQQRDFGVSPGGNFIFRLLDGRNQALFGIVRFDEFEPNLVSSIGVAMWGVHSQVWRLGDVLAAGLQPHRVFRSCDSIVPRLLIFFGGEDRYSGEIQLRGSHLRPEALLTSLEVFMPGEAGLSSARQNFGCTVEIGWHGFAPRWVYFNQS